MMMRKLPIRPFPWVSAASRRLFSFSSRAAIVEGLQAAAKITKEQQIDERKTEIEEKQGKKKKNPVPLSRRLSSLGTAPAGSVFETMNEWVREGNAAKAEELMKHVKDLRKYRRFNQALELMDWMVKLNGMNMSPAYHAIRINLISSVKGIEAAEDYFSKLPDSAKKGPTYGSLFNCYCSEKMLDKALALYDKMNELGFTSNTLLHANLMSLYMRLDQPEKVPIILQEMKANNINPDSVTYSIVMTSYASMNDIDSVEQVIREMEENKNLIIQWNAYSTLASIYISAGDLHKAESALKKLGSLIDNRDPEPFRFLISLYASTGNLEEVKRVWELLKTKFVKCNNKSYLAMLHALDKLDDIEGLKECYHEWDTTHESYDPRLTNTAISCYLRNDMIEEAESLYAKTLEKRSNLDFRTCEPFIGYYLKKKEFALALQWLELASQTLDHSKWKLNAEHLSLFLQHYEEAKDANGIEKFCKILEKLNCLGASACESLIHTYAAANRRDPSLYKRIKEGKIELKPETWKLLDKLCACQ